jgi:hypothetical protein
MMWIESSLYANTSELCFSRRVGEAKFDLVAVVAHAHLERSDGGVLGSRNASSGCSFLFLMGVRVVSEIKSLVLRRKENLLEVLTELLPGNGSKDVNLLINTVKIVLVLSDFITPDPVETF